VTLIGGDGGRIDHFIAIYDLFSEKKAPSLWLCKEQAIYLLNKNHKYTISNITPKDNISFSRLSSSRTKGKIISQNLEWESNLFRKKGMPSLSNRIKQNQKQIKLHIKGSNFLLILPLFANVLDITN
jgi:thiamine pyrophosphokinase